MADFWKAEMLHLYKLSHQKQEYHVNKLCSVNFYKYSPSVKILAFGYLISLYPGFLTSKNVFNVKIVV